MAFLPVAVPILLLCASSAAWAGDKISPKQIERTTSPLLEEGVRLIRSGKKAEAVERFDRVAAMFERQFNDKRTKYYCAQDRSESLAYMAEAAVEHVNGLVVSCNWAYAYFYKAYALIDLGRVQEAKVLLQRAVAMSPSNSQFRAELGHIYQSEKDWSSALKAFQRAEEDASSRAQKSRACRGVGFTYVEQNRLDDAEKKFRECLGIDKSDKQSANELRYIEQLRSKQGR